MFFFFLQQQQENLISTKAPFPAHFVNYAATIDFQLVREPNRTVEQGVPFSSMSL